MTSTLKEYNEIEQPYHEYSDGIFDGDFIIEEKLDGSQFRIQIDELGSIKCASKNEDLGIDSMFKAGTDSARSVLDGMVANTGELITIFAEYISKPKHGNIPYARTPKNLFTVFDVHVKKINTDFSYDQYWLNREEKEEFCRKYKLECVPSLGSFHLDKPMDKKEAEETIIAPLLKMSSYLQHQPGYDKVEGVVVKNYKKFFNVPLGHTLHGHFMCVKYVNDDYKERRHIKTPKAGNGIDHLIETCRTEARFRKAFQHLEEKGLLKYEMSDLAKLIPEVQNDFWDEEREQIGKELLKLFERQISKGLVDGIPNWYKQKLNERLEEMKNAS